jgi:uncharacterized membrane protein YeiH
VDLPVPLELAANAAGAFSGALHATRRGADVVGVLAIAVAVGLGGGMLRDVLLGAGLPLALRDSLHLEVVAACAILCVAVSPSLARIERVVGLLDAVLVGIWVVTGIQRARMFAVPTGPAMFLGVLTAVGGGVFRDMLAGERTAILLPDKLYATPAICAAGSYFLVLRIGPPLRADLAAIVVATVLRGGSVLRGWSLPTPEQLRDTIRRAFRPPSARSPRS